MNASFATTEGLRSVLYRLQDLEDHGHWAWRTDPEAARLMAFTIRRYRPLAHKHHCAPEDSAVAAFEAMRTRAVRCADDPWAVVTRAVQLSLIAEDRAAGLLCSPAQARRELLRQHHDARRFCEYDIDVTAFHPLLRAMAEHANAEPPLGPHPTTALEALDQTISLFIALGWAENIATCALDYICGRLMETGDRMTAHAALRRDEIGRAFLDLSRSSWATLLRLTLGDPGMDYRNTRAGHGLLLLLLTDHPLIELIADEALVYEITHSAPHVARRVDA